MLKYANRTYFVAGAAIIIVIIIGLASIFILLRQSERTQEIKPNQITAQLEKQENAITDHAGIPQPANFEVGNQIQASESEILFETAGTGCDSTSSGLSSEEKAFIKLINDYRQSNGLPALEISGVLNNMAANLAEDMNANNTMSHTDSKGRGLAERAPECISSFTNVKENVVTALTAQTAFNIWRNSSGHNTTMLNNETVAMGIAKSGNYWSNVFSAPNPGGTVTDDNSNPPTPTTAPKPPTATPTTFVRSLTPTSVATQPPAQNPSQGNVHFAVFIQGIGPNVIDGQNNSPTIVTKMGQVRLIDLNTNHVAFDKDLVFGFDKSNYSFTTGTNFNTPGIYEVKIRLDNSLWKSAGLLEIVGEQIYTATPNSIVSGDLNQDNTLDLGDYNIIISCFGIKKCAQKTRSDFNLDGKVDEKDLNIFYSSLAKREGD